MIKQTSYKDYILLTSEIGRLKQIINVNYHLRILPVLMMEEMVEERQRLKRIVKEKYSNWQLSKRIAGHTIYLN